MFTSDSTIAPRNAAKNPLTMNSGARNLDASMSMKALTTHQNTPEREQSQGQRNYLQNQAERRVYQANDHRRDQGGLESFQMKAWHKVGDDEQGNRTEQPVQ